MGKLSTHVLNITHGEMGVGVEIALYAVFASGHSLLKNVVTS